MSILSLSTSGDADQPCQRSLFKLIEARTDTEREAAIVFAMEHGVSLTDIESVLDWIDFMRASGR